MTNHRSALVGWLWAIVIGAMVAWLPARMIAWAASEGSKQPSSFQYDSKGRRDPFIPLVRDGHLVATGPGMHVDTSKPVLYGIVWDPAGQSMALINDGEAKVGDIVNSYRVVEIRRDTVVLDNGAERLELEIAFEAPPDEKLSPGSTTGGKKR